MVGSASGQDGRTSSNVAATAPRTLSGKRMKSCLFTCGTASLDLSLTDHATSAHVQGQHALVRLLTVVDDVSGFLRNLRQRIAGSRKANGEQVPTRDLKVFPGRLNKAVEILRKYEGSFQRSQAHTTASNLETRLTELLAGSFPEQVAVLGQEDNWYTGGCRVRGEQINSHVGSRQLFLFNSCNRPSE